MLVKCFVIEDEPLTIALLKAYVNKTPFLSCSGVATSLEDFRQIKEHHDILLLNCEMLLPLNKYLKSKEDSDLKIVLMSWDANYSILTNSKNTTDKNFTGVLHKPISYEEFLKELEYLFTKF